jgi:hypothetical protein
MIRLALVIVLLLPASAEANYSRGNVVQRWHKHRVAPPVPHPPPPRKPRP